MFGDREKLILVLDADNTTPRYWVRVSTARNTLSPYLRNMKL